MASVSHCEDCENNEAEQFCEDCPHGSQLYCSECAEMHIKKKKYAQHRMKVIGAEDDSNVLPFIEFVSDLGLSCSKTKMVNGDAVVIRKTDYNASSTFERKELPLAILQKIMACNHHCRKVFLREHTSSEPYPIIHHPMDTLLTLILCCDDIFLQEVFKRLYTCQIAIPFLLPNPDTQQITFPLWAMREIVKQWKYCNASTAGKYIPCEGRLVDCEAPIVSFMRLNKVKDLYKSKILNGVISDSRHQYFFDFECPGSDAKRCYIDGLAEISWYLPSGNPQSDIYPTPVAFCNLRGDARDHLTQFEVLASISQICFLFVRNDDVNESLKKMLCSTSRKSHVYLLTNICSNTDIVSKIPNCTVLLLKTLGGPAALVENIRLKINELLRSTSASYPSFQQGSRALSSCLNPRNFKSRFEIDEMCDPCNAAGKRLADSIMNLVASQTDKSKVKQALVPLQGHDLWQEWAKENKKQKRLNLADIGDMSAPEFYSQQDKLKDAIMKKIVAKGYSKAMKIFIDALICQARASDKKRIRLYFLHWLKLKLDDYSRETLPTLRKKCETTRNELKKLKDDEKNQGRIKALREQLYQNSHDLLSASFGLEHLFREFGVIYEMFSQLQKNQYRPALWSQVKCFPKIAAELLMDGLPLELLDGDAAHIAINWISAVLEELKKIIGEKSKLFVLSVLGIQSSGKSTLLNTAFGLRFAVSAGRCTRGAFFQLLKCDQSAFKDICDYVLVVDTEGLRAPELEHEGTQKHDNELATLVIGLAGLTIVNVFGEVSGELDDILQTSVHAFLRMKEADLRPSCVLVKHHVDDVTANKGMDGLHKLQDKLDEMTLQAAREEHCEGVYKKFSDVIQFNVEKDVHYFPNLWTSNPPMSPVEPKYSEAAQKLKMEVIKKMSAVYSSHEHQGQVERNVVCTLEEFSRRVSELWKAVLAENFIFSFKNTLEIAAFNELDQKSGKWSWDLENVVKLWEDETRRDLKAGKLESEEEQLKKIKEVEEKLDEKHEKIKTKIKDLFEKHKSASLLANWRQGTERDFTKSVENHKTNARKFCTEIVEREKLRKKVNNRAAYEDKIKEDVKKLVEEMSIDKDTKMTSTMLNDLHNKFATKWKQWMKEIEKGAMPIQSRNIAEEILQQIFTRCGVEHLNSRIREKVKHEPLSSRATTDSLFINVSKDKHINTPNKSLGKRAVNFVIESIWQRDPHQAQNVFSVINIRTTRIVQERKKYLDSVCKNKDDYPIREVIVIVQLTLEDIDQLQKEVAETFTFTAEYHVDVILTLCGYALRVFEKMQKRSYENHPVVYFKSLELVYRNNFISHCTQGVNEKAVALQNTCNAAISLAHLVMTSIRSELSVQLKNSLESKLRHKRSCFKIKKALKREVLLRLLKEKKFDLYATHLRNVSQSYRNWIKRFVDEECSQVVTYGKTFITTVAEEELQSMKASVENAVTENKSTSSIEAWLNTFHDRVQYISVTQKQLLEYVGQHPIEQFKLFKEEFLKKFGSDIKDLVGELQSVSWQPTFEWCKDQVQSTFYKKTTGCCAQCPFCGEQCESTTEGHAGNHSCDMHRPQCLGGYRNLRTQEMVLKLCNEDIQGDGTFQCKATNQKEVPYKDYRKYFKDWMIDPSATHVPRYWQWFIGAYTRKIAEEFSMKEPVKDQKIVSSWRSLTPVDAEKDVEEKYKEKVADDIDSN